MEGETTSFIPKSAFPKPASKTFYKDAGTGLFVKLSVFLFLISGLAWGGLFAFEKKLAQQVQDFKEPIERIRGAFDPALIQTLEETVARLNVAEQLLKNHPAPTGFFELLQKMTYSEVRFTNFNLSNGGKGQTSSVGGDAVRSGAWLALKGEAKSYTAIAKQDEIFKNNSDKIYSASFGQFNLTDKGLVEFSLSLEVDPSLISYE